MILCRCYQLMKLIIFHVKKPFVMLFYLILNLISLTQYCLFDFLQASKYWHKNHDNVTVMQVLSHLTYNLSKIVCKNLVDKNLVKNQCLDRIFRSPNFRPPNFRPTSFSLFKNLKFSIEI